MNGGRLSDDEAFLLGLGELRGLLAGSQPDEPAAARAFNRIAVRFPDEADQLRTLWPDAPQCGRLLQQLEARHRADTEEDD